MYMLGSASFVPDLMKENQASADFTRTMQACPICGVGLSPNERYPQYICSPCASEAVDKNRRQVVFLNTHIGGGILAQYRDTDEIYESCECYIRGVRCLAEESHMGGIVMQPLRKQITATLNSWHVSVAAESLVACLFARLGYDVSVQYGANQPEYDLMISRGDRSAKVSVKGSKDGSWGLTQKYLQDANYAHAIAQWEAAHSSRTIFALVQFQGVELNELPRVYVATPREIANRLRETARGRGDTILYEKKEWTLRAYAAGTVDAIPENWRFSEERVGQLMDMVVFSPIA